MNHSNITIKSRNNKKPWFNQSCRHKRNMYFAAKRNHNKVHSDLILGNLQLKYVCKEYMGELNLQLKKYKNNFHNELRSLKNKDPKAYWNLIIGSSVNPLEPATAAAGRSILS